MFNKDTTKLSVTCIVAFEALLKLNMGFSLWKFQKYLLLEYILNIKIIVKYSNDNIDIKHLLRDDRYVGT